MALILISAGEASGDTYAAWLVQAVKERMPGTAFFGCAGERLKSAGCDAVVDAHSIATVGLREVLGELPRVYREYKKLLAEIERRKPDLAVLVDSPDFNLRVARHLKRLGVPVLYLVAPQAWAWRPWRAAQIARSVDRLLCIFPFEEEWFHARGVNAEYIGHPLVGRVKPTMPTMSRTEFLAQWQLRDDSPIVMLLPGSRRREIELNLPPMIASARLIRAQCVIAAAPHSGILGGGLKVIQGATYDALAHADVAVVASGTVTVETALLGTPMVVVYRVTQPTWLLGRLLVRTPFYSMVNLIAGKRVVPELIQGDFVPARVAEETNRLLESPPARAKMRGDLAEVSHALATAGDPMARAAGRVLEMMGIPNLSHTATRIPA